MANSGIYRIQSSATPRVYIGASKNINSRIATHLSPDTPQASTNAHLQKAMKRLGYDTFSGKVLCLCPDDIDSNFLAFLEGVFTIWHHFVKDAPLFNVHYTAGEKFTNDVSTITNLVTTCESIIAGLESGAITVNQSGDFWRMTCPGHGTVIFYEWDAQMFLRVLPYLKMMELNTLSTLNQDVLSVLPLQHKYRDTTLIPYNISRMIVDNYQQNERWKYFQSLTTDEERDAFRDEEEERIAIERIEQRMMSGK